MSGDATAALALAAELARRDELVASEIATIRELAERSADVRSRAVEVRAALEALPNELAEVATRLREAETERATARADVQAAEDRVAQLRGARRRRNGELERAEREATHAAERLGDAEAQVERLVARANELHDDERVLLAERERLVVTARATAVAIREAPRIAETALADPGTTLDELDDWGGRVRSALFVARGSLDTERERIVAEANALGTAVLGEALGASSVALVRGQLEAYLRS